MNPTLGDPRGQPPAEPDIDRLIRAAELMGQAWRRLGHDVPKKLRQHSPHWPGRRDRARLVAACLAGARRRGGRA
jgi:hypothetical protein